MKKVFFALVTVVLFAVMFSALSGISLMVVMPIILLSASLSGKVQTSFNNGVSINSITQDYVFQKAKSIIAGLKRPDGSPVQITDQMLTQSTLRSEILMSTGSTQFHIPITVNDAQNGQAAFITENRLNLQDLFCVTELFVGCAKPTGANDGSFEVFPYPTLAEFTANANSAILGAFNNGSISYTNNNRVVTPYWDLKRHLKTSLQQYQLHPGYAANANAYADSQDGASDGYYPVEPGWILSGGSNMQMTLNLPAAMANVDANSRFIVMFRGILLQNLSGIR